MAVVLLAMVVVKVTAVVVGWVLDEGHSMDNMLNEAVKREKSLAPSSLPWSLSTHDCLVNKIRGFTTVLWGHILMRKGDFGVYVCPKESLRCTLAACLAT